jgi:hypothetical protein
MKASEIIEEAVENVKLDQATASIQIDDLATLIGENSSLSVHKDMGPVLAKYVETRQRSNEQLIKLAEIQRKIDSEELASAEQVELDEDSIYEALASDSP